MADPSLERFTIAVTADRGWEEQTELLLRRGASVVHVATVRTVMSGPDDELFAVTERLILEPPSALLIVTGLGVRSWFAAARSWGVAESLTSSLRRSRIVASPAAARAIRSVGLDADIVVPDIVVPDTAVPDTVVPDTVVAALSGQAGRPGPSIANPLVGPAAPPGAALVRTLSREGLGVGVVAVERASQEDPSLAAACRTVGASVVEVPVHRWLLPPDIEAVAGLATRTADGEIDAITFTSAPALRNLALVAEEFGSLDRLRAACGHTALLAAVGPVCAAAARQLELRGVVMPERFRIAPMIDALAEALLRGAPGSRRRPAS